MLTNLDTDRRAADYGTRARLAEAEVDRHLQHTPWIDLGVAFDHARAYAEAMALAHRFVIYKSDPSYDVTGWRGLALQALDGDETRVATTVAPESAARSDADYVTTRAAEACPTIMALVEQLLELDRTRTVALLLLEPGATIHPHVDGSGPVVMRSINVALNMPDACRFIIGCRPDGSETPTTRRIPFRPGTAMVVNVAQPHYVVNDSATPRVHLVARGGWRISPLTVLARARQQNGANVA